MKRFCCMMLGLLAVLCLGGCTSAEEQTLAQQNMEKAEQILAEAGIEYENLKCLAYANGLFPNNHYSSYIRYDSEADGIHLFDLENQENAYCQIGEEKIRDYCEQVLGLARPDRAYILFRRPNFSDYQVYSREETKEYSQDFILERDRSYSVQQLLTTGDYAVDAVGVVYIGLRETPVIRNNPDGVDVYLAVFHQEDQVTNILRKPKNEYEADCSFVQKIAGHSAV